VLISQGGVYPPRGGVNKSLSPCSRSAMYKHAGYYVPKKTVFAIGT